MKVIRPLVIKELEPIHFAHLEDLQFEVWDLPLAKRLIVRLVLDHAAHYADFHLDVALFDLDRHDIVGDTFESFLVLLEYLRVFGELLLDKVCFLLS